MSEPRTHRWMFISDWSNGHGSNDRFEYCSRCGIVRKSYTHHGVANSPTFYGVDIEDGTIDVPACVPYVQPVNVPRTTAWLESASA